MKVSFDTANFSLKKIPWATVTIVLCFVALMSIIFVLADIAFPKESAIGGTVSKSGFVYGSKGGDIYRGILLEDGWRWQYVAPSFTKSGDSLKPVTHIVVTDTIPIVELILKHSPMDDK